MNVPINGRRMGDPGRNAFATHELTDPLHPPTSVKAQLQTLPAAKLTPSGKAHAERVKRQNLECEVGQPRNAKLPSTMWDNLREFHQHNKPLSIAAGMCATVALSTALGLISGWVIDEFAHATDRKNDKVGLVIGLFIGVATALTQTISMFALARKGELHFNARSFSHDTGTSEGQSFWIIARRNPVMMAAMIRNAKSLKGWQHDDLMFLDTHVRDGMNMCTKYGWDKKVWINSIDEVSHISQVGRDEYGDLKPYWRATVDSPASGFVKGKYYVAKHSGVKAFLEREQVAHFSEVESLRTDIIGLAQEYVRKNPNCNVDGSDIAEFKRTITDMLKQKHTANGSGLHFAEGTLEAQFNGRTKDNGGSNFDAAMREILKGAGYTRTPTDFGLHWGNDKHPVTGAPAEGAKEVRNANDLIQRLIKISGTTDLGVSKSGVRYDEITKVKPIFAGFRPPSLHTWLANLRDSTFAMIGSATNGESQGGVAGNQIFMFIPLTITASVMSVLCLGMSSTGTGTHKPKGQNGNNNTGNSQAVDVFPSYESASNKPGSPSAPVSKSSLQQVQQAVQQTPLQQALNQGSGPPVGQGYFAVA